MPYGKSQAAVDGNQPVDRCYRELAGYKNVSNFSVAFKRYFGHTPGWFRKIV